MEYKTKKVTSELTKQSKVIVTTHWWLPEGKRVGEVRIEQRWSNIW